MDKITQYKYLFFNNVPHREPRVKTVFLDPQDSKDLMARLAETVPQAHVDLREIRYLY